ncbi:MAG: hypothetical protein JW818_13480 [Pirellulales bacterium]|nr:hypothetical protein [Pirellulales bacterium]
MSSSPSKKASRKHLFVDPKVQGALVWRVILYWMVCIGTMTMMLLCWRIVTGPARMFYTHLDDMWFHYGPALIVSLVMVPLVVVDIIRLSNRFAGPMLRLRRGMRELARGEHVEPIRFRDGDFWQDFAEEFNVLVERVQSSQKPDATSSSTPTSTTAQQEDGQEEPEAAWIIAE